jgi:hypothetical protein
MRKIVRAGAKIFDKQEPEPHKNGLAPQHWSLHWLLSIQCNRLPMPFLIIVKNCCFLPISKEKLLA